MNEQNFPKFRRYSNGKSYFRILSLLEMEEIQVIGSSYTVRNITATILPERYLIADLIEASLVGVEKLEKHEFLKAVADIKSNNHFKAL